MKYARDLVPQIDELPSRQRSAHPEITDELFWQCYEISKDYSMLHVTGFYNVYQSLVYLSRSALRGCAVECGSFLGGVAVFIGLLRQHLSLKWMAINIFDTFEGPPVGSADIVTGQGSIVTPSLLPDYENAVRETITTIVGSLDGYSLTRGLVEDTVPKADVGAISLLRLDTDFYSSTKIELEVLYPRLVSGGVIIVDDYGMFMGSRRATDEYLASLAHPPLLNRIDLSIWAGVKP